MFLAWHNSKPLQPWNPPLLPLRDSKSMIGEHVELRAPSARRGDLRPERDAPPFLLFARTTRNAPCPRLQHVGRSHQASHAQPPANPAPLQTCPSRKATSPTGCSSSPRSPSSTRSRTLSRPPSPDASTIARPDPVRPLRPSWSWKIAADPRLGHSLGASGADVRGVDVGVGCDQAVCRLQHQRQGVRRLASRWRVRADADATGSTTSH